LAKIIRRETRKRGFFGWVFLLLFWAFNALMLWWLVAGLGAVSQTPVHSTAEESGRAIGGFIGGTMVMFVWVAGAVILGLFALLTRGSKTIVEETVQ
jgi:hypothetical protein